MRKETVEFTNAAGNTLHGIVHHAVGKPRALAVFAHCFTCSANSKAAVAISTSLARQGVSTLRFDFTGLGESDGEFGATNFSTSVADVVAATKDFEQRLGQAVEILVGHSLGGTAALMAGLELPQVRAIATLGAPADPAHVTGLIRKATVSESADSVEVNLAGQSFSIDKQLFDDLSAQAMPERVARLRAAILVMHSPLDDIVEISNASQIFLNALHPKSFVTLDNADHLLTNARDADYAGSLIATWAERYLSESRREPAAADATATTLGGGFVTALDIGGHSLIADEPAGVGGEDLGPAPTALLSGALAACTSMTLQMYARRKGLALDQVTVAVNAQREMKEVDGEKRMHTQFERTITLDGELDSAQRGRLIEIAERCPVHRTLEGEVEFSTREA